MSLWTRLCFRLRTVNTYLLAEPCGNCLFSSIFLHLNPHHITQCQLRTQICRMTPRRVRYWQYVHQCWSLPRWSSGQESGFVWSLLRGALDLTIGVYSSLGFWLLLMILIQLLVSNSGSMDGVFLLSIACFGLCSRRRCMGIWLTCFIEVSFGLGQHVYDLPADTNFSASLEVNFATQPQTAHHVNTSKSSTILVKCSISSPSPSRK